MQQSQQRSSLLVRKALNQGASPATPSLADTLPARSFAFAFLVAVLLFLPFVYALHLDVVRFDVVVRRAPTGASATSVRLPHSSSAAQYRPSKY